MKPEYNPSCAMCRDTAGKNRAGVRDDSLCVEHLKSALAAAKERIKVLENALKFIASQEDKRGNWAVEIARSALEVKP